MMNAKQRRNQRQRQLHAQFSVLPRLTPVNDHRVYLINHSTPTSLLPDLIRLTRQTMTFTIDTEQDYYSHQPALIHIEFVQMTSMVILVEICHLPHRESILFWLLRCRFKAIFQADKWFLGWGDFIDELTSFIDYGLFSSSLLKYITTIDVQARFKVWYNDNYPYYCHVSPSVDDHMTCICSHRPVKNLNNKWSLQKAIAYLFDEFLDKTRTKSDRSHRLESKDVRRYSITNRKENESRELIVYAVNDCLAVTKLFVTMQAD